MQSHLERISFDLILLLPLVLYLPGGCIRPFQSQVVPFVGTDLGTATCSSADEFICFVLDRAKKGRRLSESEAFGIQKWHLWLV